MLQCQNKHFTKMPINRMDEYWINKVFLFSGFKINCQRPSLLDKPCMNDIDRPSTSFHGMFLYPWQKYKYAVLAIKILGPLIKESRCYCEKISIWKHEKYSKTTSTVCRSFQNYKFYWTVVYVVNTTIRP